MITNYKKNKKSGVLRYFWLHFGGIIVIIIAISLVVANVKMHQKKQELALQVAALQNQIEDIKQSNENLKEGLENVDNTQYMEKVAREELDLQKPGENVISFVMPPEKPKADSQQNVVQIWGGWLGGVLHWISGK